MINIQNIDDNKCFEWCLATYVHPTNHNPRRITKANKDFAKNLDFKDIENLLNTGNIYKINKNNSIIISVFGYKIKKKSNLCIKKKCCEENKLIY